MNITPYIQIARPSHWFKNIFMLPGVVLIFFFDPSYMTWSVVPKLVFGFIATCLIASSNYVLNEILDAEKDKHHPHKASRPIPSGQVSVGIAYAEWLVLAAAGFALSFAIHPMLGACGVALWVMGTLYNIPPIRLKDVAYADVLSESINNPLRLAMGWYATGFHEMPPLSALLAYWMFGAFLMAMKRFAEYRTINDTGRAAAYRKSFGYYNEERLIESMTFYGATFGMLSGFFIARYHIDLILATPVVAVAMAYYMKLGFRADSPVQNPEQLYRQPLLMILVIAAFIACVALLLYDVPLFHRAIEPRVLPPQL